MAHTRYTVLVHVPVPVLFTVKPAAAVQTLAAQHSRYIITMMRTMKTRKPIVHISEPFTFWQNVLRGGWEGRKGIAC